MPKGRSYCSHSSLHGTYTLLKTSSQLMVSFNLNVVVQIIKCNIMQGVVEISNIDQIIISLDATIRHELATQVVGWLTLVMMFCPTF